MKAQKFVALHTMMDIFTIVVLQPKAVQSNLKYGKTIVYYTHLYHLMLQTNHIFMLMPTMFM